MVIAGVPFFRESLRTAALIFSDSLRQNILGAPAGEGKSSRELAEHALRANSKKIQSAGFGHFRYLWVSDFAKGARGSLKVLPRDYCQGQVRLMIAHSLEVGHVASCFSETRGFDMPCARADNLPWLLFAARECGVAAAELQGLVSSWETENFKDGLLGEHVTGDWMDSVKRPSSTYNNVMALQLLLDARALGLKTAHAPEALAQTILARRWKDGGFIDCAGSQDPGLDAAATALYLGLFGEDARRALMRQVEDSGAATPLPLRTTLRGYDPALMSWASQLTPKYQGSTWLHMGLMYLNGLKRLGCDVAAQQAAIEAVFMKNRNIVEALDETGEPYRNWVKCSEYGLSMAAGQYLELAG